MIANILENRLVVWKQVPINMLEIYLKNKQYLDVVAIIITMVKKWL